MNLNQETDDEEALREELALEYGLAGMATFIEASGGNVVEVTIEGLEVTFEVEDEHPFRGFDRQQMGNVDPASILLPLVQEQSPLEILETAIAQIGAETALFWTAAESPARNKLSNSFTGLPWIGAADSEWHESLSDTFAKALGIEARSNKWREFVELIYQDSRDMLLRNWYAVDSYRAQLSAYREIRHLMNWSMRGLTPSLITEKKVRAMWEEVKFITELPHPVG